MIPARQDQVTKKSVGASTAKKESTTDNLEFHTLASMNESPDLDKTCYKKTFLKDVILRIDFGSRVESLSRSLPQKIASAALKRFPISEPQKGQIQAITVSPTTVESSTQDIMEWTYHGRTRKKTLVITPESLAITYTHYESFEVLCEDYRMVTKKLFKSINELSVSRVGLRYINILEIDGDNPLSWGDYVNKEMLGIIDMHPDKDNLTRIFHIVEYNDDGQQLRFQFGIANPDYPAPIRRRQFILDLDSYFSGDILEDQIDAIIDSSHTQIQRIFEQSITDATRAIMNRG
jgi:uncharacterized protein (TIGR04255 family)